MPHHRPPALGRGLLACAAILVWTSVGAGPVGPDEPALVLARESAIRAADPAMLRIDVDVSAYRALWERGRGTVVDFPLARDKQVDLVLEAFQVMTRDAVFVSVDEHGKHVRPRPDVRFFRGRVTGDEESLVVLGLFQHRIAGFVRTAQEGYGFGPARFSLAAPEAMEILVWNRSAESGGASCGNVDDPLALARPFPTSWSADARPAVARDHLGAVQLALPYAIDSTTEWCAHFGNDVNAAETFLLSVAAQLSALYDSELQILVQVPFLRTHCGAVDPYTDGLTQLSDRSQLLSELSAHWSSTMGGVTRATTHLFSRSDDASGFAGGLANTVVCSTTCDPVLCDNDFAYGVNLLPANSGTPATFELQVVAHELGHNHSSPHTNCLQDGASTWLSTCAVESCGVNPWCQSTGCYPGPQDTNMTGTVMSAGCDSRISDFDDDTVEPILRGAADSASCVAAAGLPGDVRQETGDELRLAPAVQCPAQALQNDDGSINQNWSACGGCQYGWIKRFTPSCFPFQLTRVDGRISNVSAGRPIRIVVYGDPAGTGDPVNATLLYTEDTTVVTTTAFNEYALSTPVTVTSGDLYIGFYDLQVDNPAPFMAALDTSVSGDSYNAFNSTDPSDYSLRPEGTWMIRGLGGAVPAGSVRLDWGLPCNDATTPNQDFAVYRGDIGIFGDYTSLTCSTDGEASYLAQGVTSDSFFLVVPHTTTSEGSYGLAQGVERAPATVACKTQSAESCP